MHLILTRDRDRPLPPELPARGICGQLPNRGYQSTGTLGDMRISIVQRENLEDKAENLEAILEAIDRAGRDSADLVVFPEASMKAFGSGRLDTAAEPLDGDFAEQIRQAADRAGLTVVVGMFTPADTVEVDGKKINRIHNTLLATGRGVEARYDKIRLFDAFGFRESDTVAPGSELSLIDVPLTNAASTIRVGLSTCFDVRFPEQFVELAERGADVIVLPAAWNDGPGKLPQWRTLTAARALDSTTFLVAVDAARPGGAKKAGEAEGPTGIGHSAVIGPDGQLLAEAGYEPQQFSVDVPLDDLARIRKQIPVLEVRSSD